MNEQPARSAQGLDTAYDSVWAVPDAVQSSSALEQVMLANDKLYVVLAVVLIIWLGLVFFVLRTDKKLDRLERDLADRIGTSNPDSLNAP